MIDLPDTPLPNVWGEGAIFGFSGMDGETQTAGGFVATAADTPFDLLFHTPVKRRLRICVAGEATVRVATGDVLSLKTPGGALDLTWGAWHTLVGEAPNNATLLLGFADDEEGQASPGRLVTTLDGKTGDVVGLLRRGERFVVAYGTDQDEAEARCTAGMEIDLAATVRQRLAVVAALPRLEDEVHDRLQRKCVSVMKVNTLAPEGAMARRWSTPDRVPHKHMWLWDSVFHALGMNHVDPQLAQDFLRVMIDSAATEGESAGMISHCARVNGERSAITQPPILAWGVLENLRAGADPGCLEEILPALEAYLTWDLANRDANQNHLLEWHIEGDPRCRSGESGLDNSPRFDSAAQLDAVDFSVFAAHDAQCLATLLDMTGAAEKAAAWRERAAAVEEAIHVLLWSEADGFYYDRTMEGTFTGVKAVTGFLPLLLESLPAERVPRLKAMLHAEPFATACPIPSVAATDPQYGTDMWRGATWVNLNYLIALGFERQGEVEEATRLRRLTIQMVQKYYAQYGVVFEFYDAADQLPPVACERKGPADGEPYLLGKMNSIRDYHWTAALTLCMLRA